MAAQRRGSCTVSPVDSIRLFTVVASFLLLVVPGALRAQPRIISFTATAAGTGAAVTLDSIRVRNLTQRWDTLLVGVTTLSLDRPNATEPTAAPGALTLRAVAPSLPHAAASFTLTMPAAARVHLAVYSMHGAEVATRTDELAVGSHAYQLGSSGLAAGSYIVVATVGNEMRAAAVACLRAGEPGRARIMYAGVSPYIPPAAAPSAADTYTFIGYVRTCYADTLENIAAESGRTYTFTVQKLPTRALVTGPQIEVARSVVAVSGGRVVVTAPNTPVTGLTIDVPPNSYTADRTFSVAYSRILDSGFGDTVRLLSPLITITNGGGYADSAMLIKIPITLPPGFFAMAFYYDRDTRVLEGLPIAGLTDSAVYVYTRHLSGDLAGMGKAGSGPLLRNWADVIVAGIATGDLTGKISSGFSPGVDDWEFINWGSYIAPGGHCTGQSLTAMWYYVNKKLRFGADALHDLLDEVHADSMWMDNPHGYKFASVVWAGLHWQQRYNWRTNHFEAIGKQKISEDSLHYLGFAFSIRNTGHPQLVEIWRLDGTWKGHAMIVYETEGGSLRIADPNYPGTMRGTRLNAGKFDPYLSGDNAGNVGNAYPVITYIATSAITSFGEIGERWKQTYEKTIGTVPPNSFPSTSVFLLEGGQTNPLPDLVNTTEDSISVFATCATCTDKLAGDRTPMRLTDEQGRFVTWSGDDGVLRFPVKGGTTRYGLTIYGYAGPGKTKRGYVDFRWLTVQSRNYVNASISCSPLDARMRVEDRTSGTLVVSFENEILQMTSLMAGPQPGVYGTLNKNVYTHDTTYTIAGNFTHTEHIRVVVNDSATMVTEFTFTHTRLQAGDWTDQTSITGRDIPLEKNGSTDDYDRFSILTGDVTPHLTSVQYNDQRLDRDYKQSLESWTARGDTKIRITLSKK
ncbi:MAG: hypothetical protein HY962_06920 [Ignavibacteriae bacterium]|nr:hypothetical protein [Ignavibacteriota bacterium]